MNLILNLFYCINCIKNNPLSSFILLSVIKQNKCKNKLLHKSVLDAFIRILSVHQFARSQTMSKYFVNTTSIYDNVKYLFNVLKTTKIGFRDI